MTTSTSIAGQKPKPTFTQGSTLRHVLVMTATGSIGLMAIFVVDLLSLIYVSHLGDTHLTAAVGYASTVMFFGMSINIGLVIATSAAVARALGAGDRPRARRTAASSLALTAAIAAVVAALMIFYRFELLALIGASGSTAQVAANFLLIVMPANVLMGLGMGFSGVLRAVGDAKRAMNVTLFGGLVTAFTDPLFIFGLGFGVYGAAIATVISRFVFAGVGFWGAVKVHDLVAKPRLPDVLQDSKMIGAIALPAILTNIATPVGQSYAMKIFSRFGEDVIAAFAVIDRITPVAFCVIFALTGSLGPVLSQNLGAKLMGRVRKTLDDAFLLTIVYVVVVWTLLWLGSGLLVKLFGVSGETASLLKFYCTFGASLWLFLGALFVANTSFNNLGFPLYSTFFNWGRATIGTIPFVTYFADHWGVEGGMVGMIVGSAIFGIAGAIVAYFVTARLAKQINPV